MTTKYAKLEFDKFLDYCADANKKTTAIITELEDNAAGLFGHDGRFTYSLMKKGQPLKFPTVDDAVRFLKSEIADLTNIKVGLKGKVPIIKPERSKGRTKPKL